MSAEESGYKKEALQVESNRFPTMMRVQAPTDLPPGYRLQVADKYEQKFYITVPNLGVKQGDVFIVPTPDGYQHDELIYAPKGQWRDGICDCCTHGPCHPSVACAMYCTPILMGQVMERTRLTFFGNLLRKKFNPSAFKVVLILTATYAALNTIFSCYMAYKTDVEEAGNGGYQVTINYGPIPIIAKNILGVAFGLFCLIALMNTRRNVRGQYAIPEERCYGCEDLCCAFFCTCCTVAQVARQTGDYAKNPAKCCSNTGLPEHVPYAAPMAV